MIEIQNRANCCGCGACVQKCHRHCISFNEDKEGFFYPVVDKQSCVDCGLCESVCPFLFPYDERNPKRTVAAVNRNEDIRLDSSSGGVFSILANQIIEDGGIVFGARYDERWNVIMDSSDTVAGASVFRGSKYVQADTNNSFWECEQLLKHNTKVLYCGTPCQISALKHFLNKDYVNLLTVDFVCHGVPSPKVWKMYLKEVSKYSKIKYVSMRNKEFGWADFHLKILGENGANIVLSSHKQNEYMRAFLSDMILRPSCYECKAKENRSYSDITLGDFWGIDSICPEINDDKGISLVLVHSEKGEHFIREENMFVRELDYYDVVNFNKSIVKSVSPWPRRDEFFRRLNRSRSVTALIQYCLEPEFDFREFMKQRLKVVIKFLHIILDRMKGIKL